MNMRKLPVTRGSGNVFRDFHARDADLLQLKALLGAHIVRALDEHGWSVRQAGALTKTAAADFSRIRNANLDRFTVDRLLTILGRLGKQVDVAIAVRPRRRGARSHATA